MQEQIIRTDYAEVMQKSYVDYAMSVIISRALPDIRDGLKPVQRRTLYDMYELAIRYDKPYRKCARIVGDTMGKYHPHGDSSIYDALVVMAQDFKKGMPLVDGHGNFGSIEGDGAAAMRYTEARLQKVTQEVFLADLDKDVVDFMPNFDETEKEPTVLPVRLPNFLVNGSDGIAVGMVTSTPPHNLGEVIDAVKAYMKNDKLTTADLMQYIQGPDFPTGGIKDGDVLRVSIDVENTGKMAGSEVVQLYVSDKDSTVPRAVKELKGFAKVFLNPGEKKTVTMELCARDFAYYETKIHDWYTPSGTYEIQIGHASDDIRETAKLSFTTDVSLPFTVDMTTTMGELMSHPKTAGKMMEYLEGISQGEESKKEEGEVELVTPEIIAQMPLKSFLSVIPGEAIEQMIVELNSLCAEEGK